MVLIPVRGKPTDLIISFTSKRTIWFFQILGFGLSDSTYASARPGSHHWTEAL